MHRLTVDLEARSGSHFIPLSKSGPSPSHRLMRAVLDRSALERLRDAALARHEHGRLDAVGRDPGASSLTGPDWTWVRSSQSITLGPLLDDALQLVMASAFGDLVRQRFEQPLCIASQAWIRRQHPPAHRPPCATPHSWHQDGALGFDFLSPPAQPRLLPLLACWIPLDPCGRNAASLEIVDANLNELLLLNRLTDEKDEAFSAGPCRAIKAQPTDIVVMEPGTLHRTWVHGGMSKIRTSIGIRFVEGPQPPVQLRRELCVPVHIGAAALT